MTPRSAALGGRAGLVPADPLGLRPTTDIGPHTA